MIGPKMYNAEATLQDDAHQGSTFLHLDMTDAVNVMIWAATFPDGRPGYAVWHIFPRDASPIVRQFLREEVGFEGEGDPIHSQMICMTPTLLERLFSKHGIRPYTIYQYVGDAIYIPAGCAHQVCHCDKFSCS